MWVPRVTQGTEFPDERVRRTCATSQAVACSEPRCSLVNFSEGVDSVVVGGKGAMPGTDDVLNALDGLAG